jgi:hypothetical protein
MTADHSGLGEAARSRSPDLGPVRSERNGKGRLLHRPKVLDRGQLAHNRAATPQRARLPRAGGQRRQVAYARCRPDITPLHLRKAQIAIADHIDEFAYCGIDLGHAWHLLWYSAEPAGILVCSEYYQTHLFVCLSVKQSTASKSRIWANYDKTNENNRRGMVTGSSAKKPEAMMYSFVFQLRQCSTP